MEPILAIIISAIISSLVTRLYLSKDFKLTKRSIFNNLVKKHLNAIYNELENLTKFPHKYYVGETNDYVCELADKISIKLRQKGFDVLRDTNEATCEVLIIS